LTAGALEGNGKAGCEDLDRKVVQVAAPSLDFADETALERRGHADEDVTAFLSHHTK
jgi:hypothetical protein